jgi:hypothetical protein
VQGTADDAWEYAFEIRVEITSINPPPVEGYRSRTCL